MEAAPSSASEMPEPDFRLKLLIVALDSPPPSSGSTTREGDVSPEVLKARVFERIILAFRPIDQQPVFRSSSR